MAKVCGALWELVSSVAPYLDGRFVDMDQVIEEENRHVHCLIFCKRKVKQPFARLSLRLWRNSFKEGDDVIISTGGGVVVTGSAIVSNVWLHASFDVVYDRIEKDTKNQRPLFLNHSKEDFKAIMMTVRMALYQFSRFGCLIDNSERQKK